MMVEVRSYAVVGLCGFIVVLGNDMSLCRDIFAAAS